MEPWHIWVIVALLLFIIEIFASGYIVVCLAIGAVGGTIAAICDTPVWVQILAFVLVTLFVFVSVRPVIHHYQQKGIRRAKTGPHVGKVLKATEPIPAKTVGRIRIGEYDWQVSVVDGDEIRPGDEVEVLKQNTGLLKVKKL